jgi:hypothetical protein
MPSKSPSVNDSDVRVLPWSNVRARQWLAGLPSFCRPIIDDETSSVVSVDFWAVEASGDDEFDRFFGELLAQDARDYARRSAQPEFVDLVLVWLSWVTRGEFGPFERAFIEHVMRNDPRYASRRRHHGFGAHRCAGKFHDDAAVGRTRLGRRVQRPQRAWCTAHVLTNSYRGDQRRPAGRPRAHRSGCIAAGCGNAGVERSGRDLAGCSCRRA